MKYFTILLFVLSFPAFSQTPAEKALMTRIVYAESCGETIQGKVWVATVILNRVDHKGYPKTITKVILQRNAFSCVSDGSRLWKASEYPNKLKGVSKARWDDCRRAVEIACENRPNSEVVAYRTTSCKNGGSYFNKLEVVARIGNHIFYKE